MMSNANIESIAVEQSRSLWVKAVVWLTLSCFAGQPILSFAQAASAIVPTNGGSVSQTSQGRPLVNIVAPNGAGISQNRYSQFDVGTQGAALNNNNSGQSVTLQQMNAAGQADRAASNPNLGANAAKVIINQVQSSSASQLRGALEVAGQKADVVVANPNGITCNGCGFINSARGVLTTGTVDASGNLLVNSGTLNIAGQGLIDFGTPQIDLAAMNILISGKIQGAAQNGQATTVGALNIIAGQNNIDYADPTHPRPIAGAPTTSAAIDVSGLGGMYAQKIMLISTAQGVGVNSAGTIHSASDVTVATDGSVTLGATDSTTKTSGAVTAGGNVTIKGYGAAGAASINNNNGKIIAGGAVNLNTSGALNNQSALMQSGGAMSLTGSAAGMNNTSGQLLAGSTLSIATMGGAFNNTSGFVQSQGGTSLTVDSLDNTAGTIQDAGTGALNLIVANALNNGANGQIQSKAGNLTINAGSIANSGQFGANSGAVSLRAGQGITNSGTVQSGQGLTINAASLNNTSGTLQDTGTQNSTMTVGALTNTGGKLLVNRGDLAVTAGTINNSGGTIGAKNASIDLTATSGAISNTNQGNIQATNGNVVMSANGVDNSNGLVGALAGSVYINANNGTFTNTKGSVQSSNGLTIKNVSALDNTAGILADTDSGAVNITAASLNNITGAYNATTSGGVISSRAGALNLALTGALNNSGLINAGKDSSAQTAQLNIGGAFDNSGTIQSTADLVFNFLGSATQNNSATGKLVAGNNLTLANIGMFTNSGGSHPGQDASGQYGLYAGRNLTISGNTLTNGSAAITNGSVTPGSTIAGGVLRAATGNVNLTLGQLINNVDSAIVAVQGDVTATGMRDSGNGHALINQGVIYGGRDVVVSSTPSVGQSATFDNLGGMLGDGVTPISPLIQAGRTLSMGRDCTLDASGQCTVNTWTAPPGSVTVNNTASLNSLKDIFIQADVFHNSIANPGVTTTEGPKTSVLAGTSEKSDFPGVTTTTYFYNLNWIVAETFNGAISALRPSITANNDLIIRTQTGDNIGGTLAGGRSVALSALDLSNQANSVFTNQALVAYKYTYSQPYQKWQTCAVLLLGIRTCGDMFDGDPQPQAAPIRETIQSVGGVIQSGASGAITVANLGTFNNYGSTDVNVLSGGSSLLPAVAAYTPSNTGEAFNGQLNGVSAPGTQADLNNNSFFQQFPLPAGNNGLFIVTPRNPNGTGDKPNNRYLIVSNPIYGLPLPRYSSDYLIEAILAQKRAEARFAEMMHLGDGNYEQQLIKDQILAQTGLSFLGQTHDSDSQLQELMNNALAESALAATDQVTITIDPDLGDNKGQVNKMGQNGLAVVARTEAEARRLLAGRGVSLPATYNKLFATENSLTATQAASAAGDTKKTNKLFATENSLTETQAASAAGDTKKTNKLFVTENSLTATQAASAAGDTKKTVTIPLSPAAFELGKELTAEQQKNLTKDVVWMVAMNVGGQEVLVPKLYLSPATIAAKAGGKLLAGDITFKDVQTINNKGGVIEATNEEGGIHFKGDVGTVNNISGTIAAAGVIDGKVKNLNDETLVYRAGKQETPEEKAAKELGALEAKKAQLAEAAAARKAKEDKANALRLSLDLLKAKEAADAKVEQEAFEVKQKEAEKKQNDAIVAYEKTLSPQEAEAEKKARDNFLAQKQAEAEAAKKQAAAAAAAQKIKDDEAIALESKMTPDAAAASKKAREELAAKNAQDAIAAQIAKDEADAIAYEKLLPPAAAAVAKQRREEAAAQLAKKLKSSQESAYAAALEQLNELADAKEVAEQNKAKQTAGNTQAEKEAAELAEINRKLDEAEAKYGYTYKDIAGKVAKIQAGKGINLAVTGDMNVKGGEINATQGSVKIDVGGATNIESLALEKSVTKHSSKDTGFMSYENETLSRLTQTGLTAGIHAGKDVDIKSKADITLKGVDIKGGDNVTLASDGNYTDNALYLKNKTTSEQTKSGFYNDSQGLTLDVGFKSTTKEKSIDDKKGAASTIAAGNKLTVETKKNITIEGGIYSGTTGSITSKDGGDITFQAIRNEHNVTQKESTTKVGIKAALDDGSSKKPVVLAKEALTGDEKKVFDTTEALLRNALAASKLSAEEKESIAKKVAANRPEKEVDTSATNLVSVGFSAGTEKKGLEVKQVTHENAMMAFSKDVTIKAENKGGVDEYNRDKSNGKVDIGGLDVASQGKVHIEGKKVISTKYQDETKVTATSSSDMFNLGGKISSSIPTAIQQGSPSAKNVLSTLGSGDLIGARVSAGFQHKDETTTTTSTADNINHIVGNTISIKSAYDDKGEITLQGVDLKAKKDDKGKGGTIDVIANGNVNITAAEQYTETTKTKHSFGGGFSFDLLSPISQPLKTVKAAAGVGAVIADAAEGGKGGKAVGNVLSSTLNDLSPVAFNASGSTSTDTSRTHINSALVGDAKVAIKSSKSDVRFVGVDIDADSTAISAAKNVISDVYQDSSTHTEKSTYAGLANHDSTGDNPTGFLHKNADSVLTHESGNSINAAKDLTVTAGDDITLVGGNYASDTGVIKAEHGNVITKTAQDRGYSKGEQGGVQIVAGASAGVAGFSGSLSYGSLDGASAGYTLPTYLDKPQEQENNKKQSALLAAGFGTGGNATTVLDELGMATSPTSNGRRSGFKLDNGADALDNNSLVRAKAGIGITYNKTEKLDVVNNNALISFGSRMTIQAGDDSGKGKVDIGGADIISTLHDTQDGENNANSDKRSNLSISGKEILSTKYKDLHTEDTVNNSTFLGGKAEAHSSVLGLLGDVADAIGLAAKDKYVNVNGKGSATDSRSAQQGRMGARAAGMQGLQLAGDATNLLFGDTAGASAALALGNTHTMTYSKQTSENINRISADKVSFKTTEGNINLAGVQIESTARNANPNSDATGITIDSAKDINIRAARNTSESRTEKISNEVSRGVSAQVNALEASATATVNAGYSGSYSLDKTNETSYQNASIASASKLTIKSKGNTNVVGGNLAGKDVDLNIDGNLNITSVQDTKDNSGTQANWGISVGAGVAAKTLAEVNGGISGGGGQTWDRSARTAQQSGIRATNSLNGKVQGDVSLTGAHLESNSGQGALAIGGDIRSHTLKDTEDKDGAVIGLNIGGGLNGTKSMPKNAANSGNVGLTIYTPDVIKYAADQNATIAGINLKKIDKDGKVTGEDIAVRGDQLNKELGKETNVTEDSKLREFNIGITLQKLPSKQKDVPVVREDGPPHTPAVGHIGGDNPPAEGTIIKIPGQKQPSIDTTPTPLPVEPTKPNLPKVEVDNVPPPKKAPEPVPPTIEVPGKKPEPAPAVVELIETPGEIIPPPKGKGTQSNAIYISEGDGKKLNGDLAGRQNPEPNASNAEVKRKQAEILNKPEMAEFKAKITDADKVISAKQKERAIAETTAGTPQGKEKLKKIDAEIVAAKQEKAAAELNASLKANPIKIFILKDGKSIEVTLGGTGPDDITDIRQLNGKLMGKAPSESMAFPTAAQISKNPEKYGLDAGSTAGGTQVGEYKIMVDANGHISYKVEVPSAATIAKAKAEALEAMLQKVAANEGVDVANRLRKELSSPSTFTIPPNEYSLNGQSVAGKKTPEELAQLNGKQAVDSKGNQVTIKVTTKDDGSPSKIEFVPVPSTTPPAPAKLSAGEGEFKVNGAPLDLAKAAKDGNLNALVGQQKLTYTAPNGEVRAVASLKLTNNPDGSTSYTPVLGEVITPAPTPTSARPPARLVDGDGGQFVVKGKDGQSVALDLNKASQSGNLKNLAQTGALTYEAADGSVYKIADFEAVRNKNGLDTFEPVLGPLLKPANIKPGVGGYTFPSDAAIHGYRDAEGKPFTGTMTAEQIKALDGKPLKDANGNEATAKVMTDKNGAITGLSIVPSGRQPDTYVFRLPTDANGTTHYEVDGKALPEGMTAKQAAAYKGKTIVHYDKDGNPTGISKIQINGNEIKLVPEVSSPSFVKDRILFGDASNGTHYSEPGSKDPLGSMSVKPAEMANYLDNGKTVDLMSADGKKIGTVDLMFTKDPNTGAVTIEPKLTKTDVSPTVTILSQPDNSNALSKFLKANAPAYEKVKEALASKKDAVKPYAVLDSSNKPMLDAKGNPLILDLDKPLSANDANKYKGAVFVGADANGNERAYGSELRVVDGKPQFTLTVPKDVAPVNNAAPVTPPTPAAPADGSSTPPAGGSSSSNTTKSGSSASSDVAGGASTRLANSTFSNTADNMPARPANSASSDTPRGLTSPSRVDVAADTSAARQPSSGATSASESSTASSQSTASLQFHSGTSSTSTATGGATTTTSTSSSSTTASQSEGLSSVLARSGGETVTVTGRSGHSEPGDHPFEYAMNHDTSIDALLSLRSVDIKQLDIKLVDDKTLDLLKTAQKVVDETHRLLPYGSANQYQHDVETGNQAILRTRLVKHMLYGGSLGVNDDGTLSYAPVVTDPQEKLNKILACGAGNCGEHAEVAAAVAKKELVGHDTDFDIAQYTASGVDHAFVVIAPKGEVDSNRKVVADPWPEHENVHILSDHGFALGEKIESTNSVLDFSQKLLSLPEVLKEAHQFFTQYPYLEEQGEVYKNPLGKLVADAISSADPAGVVRGHDFTGEKYRQLSTIKSNDVVYQRVGSPDVFRPYVESRRSSLRKRVASPPQGGRQLSSRGSAISFGGAPLML